MSWESLGSTGRQNAAEVERERTSPPVDCPLCLAVLEPGRDPGTWHCPAQGHLFATGGALILLP